MGASLSREEENIENKTDTANSAVNKKKQSSLLEQKISQYAADLILRSSFKDMQSLMKKEECDKLVILTSKVIDKHFHKTDINVFSSKISGSDNNITEPIEYIKETKLHSEEKKMQEDKSQLCQGLARYYVKVAHLFAAIAQTVNPTYVYEVAQPKNKFTSYSSSYSSKLSLTSSDPETKSYQSQLSYQPKSYSSSTSGSKKNIKLKWDQLRELDNYEYTKFKETELRGFCNKRLDVLDPSGILQSPSDVGGLFEVKPNMCNANKNYKNLDSITGIPDLTELYNDEYDPETKQYSEMSDKMRKQYQSDLESFYKVFTGKKSMPGNITKFSDIELIDYSKLRGCNDESSQFPLGFSFLGGKLYKNNEGDIFFSSKDGLINVGIDDIVMDGKWPDPMATFTVEQENDFGKAGSKIQLWGKFVSHGDTVEISFINQPYGMLKRGQKGTLKIKLFNDYAEKIREMMANTQKNKDRLIEILQGLFSKNNVDGYDVVRVSDNLTEDKLDKLISDAREIIIDMYLSCEKDFKEALNIFDAIIDKQILEDSISINERLETKMNEFVGVDPRILEKELQDVEISDPVPTVTEDPEDMD
ncbi:MAG: hypothetical protein ACXABD_00485 [Candidatus Thorarchaeota archaeon]|jgi:hypothetical protein